MKTAVLLLVLLYFVCSLTVSGKRKILLYSVERVPFFKNRRQHESVRRGIRDLPQVGWLGASHNGQQSVNAVYIR